MAILILFADARLFKRGHLPHYSAGGIHHIHGNGGAGALTQPHFEINDIFERFSVKDIRN